MCCIHGYFRSGFVFASQSSQKFPLQYMAIYSNEKLKTSQILKLKPSLICPPSPKSRKYLYVKYMVYTVLQDFLLLNVEVSDG